MLYQMSVSDHIVQRFGAHTWCIFLLSATRQSKYSSTDSSTFLIRTLRLVIALSCVA